MTTSLISRRSGFRIILLIGRVADKAADDDDNDADANHEADVLHRDLTLLIGRVGFEKGGGATVGSLTARRTHVSRRTDHFG